MQEIKQIINNIILEVGQVTFIEEILVNICVFVTLFTCSVLWEITLIYKKFLKKP